MNIKPDKKSLCGFTDEKFLKSFSVQFSDVWPSKHEVFVTTKRNQWNQGLSVCCLRNLPPFVSLKAIRDILERNKIVAEVTSENASNGGFLNVNILTDEKLNALKVSQTVLFSSKDIVLAGMDKWLEEMNSKEDEEALHKVVLSNIAAIQNQSKAAENNMPDEDGWIQVTRNKKRHVFKNKTKPQTPTQKKFKAVYGLINQQIKRELSPSLKRKLALNAQQELGVAKKLRLALSEN